jgi:hypothetical protein
VHDVHRHPIVVHELVGGVQPGADLGQDARCRRRIHATVGQTIEHLS